MPFPKVGPDNEGADEPPPTVPKSLRAAQPPTPQDQVNVSEPHFYCLIRFAVFEFWLRRMFNLDLDTLF